MNNEYIKQLLQRFYNGQTTTDEENMLKEFFAHETVPEELRLDRDLFLTLKQLHGKDEKRINSMKLDLEQEIARWEQKEKATARNRRPLNRIRRYIIYATGIAAILAITYRIPLSERRPEPKDTFTNPEDAYQETEKALQLFAKALNKGTRPFMEFEKATNKIQNTLENIQK